MKRLVLAVIALVLVVVFASVRIRRRPSEPEAPDGSWEPVASSQAS
ncbi:MAG: hypothetical protein QNJ71_10670 [Acidimicrobiia bacterium]|nr:hypothetical protein [Acidimicrobiia bacterium]